jgi:hypothetical protein
MERLQRDRLILRGRMDRQQAIGPFPPLSWPREVELEISSFSGRDVGEMVA